MTLGLSRIDPEKSLEYWVYRLFPDCAIQEESGRKRIIEQVGNGVVEVSPLLTEREMLVWLDGVDAAVHTGVGFDLLDKAGWKDA
jgi:hypothetical protein